MGDKYIIELEDKPFHKEDGDFLYRVKGFNSLVFDMTGISKLTPYTEPDLEQVRKEAYQKGYETGYEDGYNEPGKNQQEAYQRGLADAWEAARKIADMPYDEGERIFGVTGWHIIEKRTADEVIEELKAREQVQKEEKSISAEESMRKYLNEFCNNTKSCTVCPLHTSDFTCGRGYHFMTENPVSDEEVRRAYAKVVKEKE